MARASAALVAAALRMTRLFQILRQQPRNQYIRAEDDHERCRVITPLLANTTTIPPATKRKK